jgi:hypothetical protein
MSGVEVGGRGGGGGRSSAVNETETLKKNEGKGEPGNGERGTGDEGERGDKRNVESKKQKGRRNKSAAFSDPERERRTEDTREEGEGRERAWTDEVKESC